MASKIESKQVTSVGRAGERNYTRSDGRAYWTLDEVCSSAQSLIHQFEDFQTKSLEHQRRRTVMRVRCTEQVFQELTAQNSLPVEVAIPLNLVDNTTSDYVLIIAQNQHDSAVPEWPEVYDFWSKPKEIRLTPVQRVERIHNSGKYQLCSTLTLEDAERLQQIWAPFGWDLDGVIDFINELPSSKTKWFSGVRDIKTHKLVSACMGELLEFAGIRYVETTEYGTYVSQSYGLRSRENQNGSQNNYEGQGLCTAVVSALHAQILRDTLYTDNIPVLIGAELNMTSRSDVLARNLGYTAPGVENNRTLPGPIQVLRYNVAVEDRGEPNHLQPHTQNSSWRTENYQYWRNFIMGVLPRNTIDTYYSPEQVQHILHMVS